jgi:hypothetical protein
MFIFALTKTKTMEKEIVKIWKENNISRINFNFSCGGDSMNDTDIEIFDKEGELVEIQELVNYFDDEVYKKVEFYVNSDGHYMGESGCVEITLCEDDEEPYFNYSKDAQSEWNEHFTGQAIVTLTDEETAFVSEFVDNINGGGDGFTINYKKDFIVTDRQEKLVAELEIKIDKVAYDFEPEDAQGEASDWITYTTNEDGEELTLEGNELTLSVSREYYVYSDSE